MDFRILSALILSGAFVSEGAALTIEIENSLPFARNEIVETDAKAVTGTFGSEFVILDREGRELPWQITRDGLLVFPAEVPAGGKVSYTIEKGSPAPVDTICYGQFVPECQDDFSWENDRAGYRLYGPSYRRDGGAVRGYDLWTKSVSRPVLADRYYDDHQRGISYHLDQGNGMDAYTVGPTLGGGLNALVLDNGEWALPWSYEKYDILDNGPLRMTARLTCYPETIDGETILESRLITLDKGSWLNRVEITYENLSKPRDMVAGIVVHQQNPKGFTLSEDGRFVSYADLTDNPKIGNGVIYIGVIVPEGEASAAYVPMSENKGDAIGHVAVTTRYTPGRPLTYLFGSGWSRGGVESYREWDRYLSQSAAGFATPLKVTVR